MEDKICIHCYITGKVQGVWFRASTQEEAEKLGLTGWVRNLPTGQVEVLACGEREKLMQLYDWLKQGPPLSRVTDLSYEAVPWQNHSGFQVL